MSKSSPRISANDLARFLVSKPSTQLTIIRNAKYPDSSKPLVIRYSEARQAIVQHLCDMSRSKKVINTAIDLFLQRKDDFSESTFRRDDAEKSIEVLEAILDMSNQTATYRFVRAPKRQSKLIIEGVEVSVSADMLVEGKFKGQDAIGAAIMRLSKDDSSTAAAKEKRKSMGLYVASLAALHTAQNIANSDQIAANKLSMSIDVMHGEIFVAPQSNAQRVKDITGACQIISTMWSSL